MSSAQGNCGNGKSPICIGSGGVSSPFLGRQHNKPRLGHHHAKHPTNFAFNGISVVYPEISAAMTLNNSDATTTLILSVLSLPSLQVRS